MSAHTPGPWTVSECSNGGALLCRPGKQSHLQIYPIEDAALMASAPTMLAALKGIEAFALEMIEDCCADAQVGGSGDGMAPWSAVIAAIHAAEGWK